MADGLTGRVLESSRTAPRPTLVPRAEPAAREAARPSLLSMAALAVIAAVIGRRTARTSAPPASTARVVRKQKVMTVYLAAGAVILAVRRPVLSAYRDHRYSSRWSRQPLGW